MHKQCSCMLSMALSAQACLSISVLTTGPSGETEALGLKGNRQTGVQLAYFRICSNTGSHARHCTVVEVLQGTHTSTVWVHTPANAQQDAVQTSTALASFSWSATRLLPIQRSPADNESAAGYSG